MNTTQFFKELNNVKNNFNWFYDFDRSIYGTLKRTNQYTKNFCFCPITAIYYIKEKKFIEIHKVEIASKKLKINYNLSDKITGANDNSYFADFKLRNKIKCCLNLS